MKPTIDVQMYYDLFSDAWMLFRRYTGAAFSETYFEDMIDNVASFTKKYNHSPISLQLAQTILNEYDGLYRQGAES